MHLKFKDAGGKDMLSLVQLFQDYLEKNIVVSIVIIAVILVRFFLRKFPKKYSYIIWAFVGIRMVFDISVSSGISLLGLVEKIRDKSKIKSITKIENINHLPVEDILLGNEEHETIIVNTADQISQVAVGETSTLSLQNLVETILPILAVLWVAGMIVILAYGIASYVNCKKLVRQAVKLKKNVWECDRISSPFVLGILSPQIYIPFHVEEEERKYILAHERYHIRRRDYLIKPFAFALLMVYWINPLAWLAFHLMSQDMEMSCDEAVLERYGNKIKKSYSTSLLSFAQERKQYSFAPIAFGEADAKKRIRNVLRFKKPKMWLVVLLILLIAVFGIACLTNSGEENTSSNTEKNDVGNNVSESEVEEGELPQTPISPELEAIYMEAVERLAKEHIFPNGEQADPYETNGATENYYKILDVDEDGRQELIINYPNASAMATMAYYIFDYDMEKGEFYEELVEWPAVTIYDNGIILAEASHNHGRSNLDDFWPYYVHQYDEESDTYKLVAQVDAWQYIRFEGAEPDADFPQEKDINGDGVVYYLPDENTFEPETIMDNEEYHQWFLKLTEGAQKIEIEYDKIPIEEPVVEIDEDIYNWMYSEDKNGLLSQMQVMAENKDMWMIEPEYANEVYQYTVIDLDRNGRFELIVSHMGGTGIYTYSRFFQINDSYDGLEECETDFIEGQSQPDLMTNEWKLCMDDSTGQFYYVVNDVLRNGAAEQYESIQVLSLKNGKVSVETLASRATIYGENGSEKICKDAEGVIISEEEYEAYVENYFDTGYSKGVAQLIWQDMRELSENQDEMAEQLLSAYYVIE